MFSKQTIRRLVVALLVLLGVAMMLMATQTMTGAILIAVGIGIEVVGIAMRHK